MKLYLFIHVFFFRKLVESQSARELSFYLTFIGNYLIISQSASPIHLVEEFIPLFLGLLKEEIRMLGQSKVLYLFVCGIDQGCRGGMSSIFSYLTSLVESC